MKKIRLTVLVIFLNIQTFFCFNIYDVFNEMNADTTAFNKAAAELAWSSSVDPENTNIPQWLEEYQQYKRESEAACDSVKYKLTVLNDTQRRMAYLLCRGPLVLPKEAGAIYYLTNYLQSRYSNFKVRLPSENMSKSNTTELENTIVNNLKDRNPNLMKHTVVLKGEEDFQNVMAYSKNEEVLKWVWRTWREMTTNMKKPYGELVKIENLVARRKGYSDMGDVWRENFEIPNLREKCRELFNRVKPLYKSLHAVVRHFLHREYSDVVPKTGLIPAHVFGNLWSQSWDNIMDLITPQSIDLDESIKRQNWTVPHMVKRAEDFYMSLGLPAMSESFWRESIFSRENDEIRCHASAADMYTNGDYRLIHCSGTSFEDFYILHHEMGHIQYFMAYENQPGLFRRANSALHESVGDAIMYGVMAPQHLYRLGLINETILYNSGNEEIKSNDINNDKIRKKEKNINQEENRKLDKGEDKIIFDSTDDVIVLKDALNKIPQIPFWLVMDEYRWKIFEGEIPEESANEQFWNMVAELSGISPPDEREEYYLDAAANFHVSDNTPTIGYFLSSFLQHQIFEALCKAAVFGRHDVKENLPNSITLNRCDIYGSKAAGKLLKELMSQGDSKPMLQILASSLGIRDVSASALLRYYRPLQDRLQEFIDKYDIPVGW